MAAERDVERAAEERQGAALALDRGIERVAGEARRRADVHRPAGADGPVVEREREDEVLLGRPRVGRGHGVEVERPGGGVDDGGARHAHRVDVATGQVRERDGRSQRPLPYDRAAGGVEGVYEVLLGGGDDDVLAAGPTLEEERLRVDGARERAGVEAGVAVEAGGRRLRQRRVHVQAVAPRTVVVVEHREAPAGSTIGSPIDSAVDSTIDSAIDSPIGSAVDSASGGGARACAGTEREQHESPWHHAMPHGLPRARPGSRASLRPRSALRPTYLVSPGPADASPAARLTSSHPSSRRDVSEQPSTAPPSGVEMVAPSEYLACPQVDGERVHAPCDVDPEVGARLLAHHDAGPDARRRASRTGRGSRTVRCSVPKLTAGRVKVSALAKTAPAEQPVVGDPESPLDLGVDLGGTAEAPLDVAAPGRPGRVPGDRGQGQVGLDAARDAARKHPEGEHVPGHGVREPQVRAEVDRRPSCFPGCSPARWGSLRGRAGCRSPGTR